MLESEMSAQEKVRASVSVSVSVFVTPFAPVCDGEGYAAHAAALSAGVRQGVCEVGVE